MVCRGPVRLEAFEVFDEIGVREYGMLLSEKDSVVYPRCLAPELRSLPLPAERAPRAGLHRRRVSRRRRPRIREIVAIALEHGYTHVFAGYGFMAEDAELVEAIEQAGLGFMGPSSHVLRRAGAKDEAKKLARSLGNAVIPGVDDVSRARAARSARRTARPSRRSRRTPVSSFGWNAKREPRGERRGAAPGGLRDDASSW